MRFVLNDSTIRRRVVTATALATIFAASTAVASGEEMSAKQKSDRSAYDEAVQKIDAAWQDARQSLSRAGEEASAAAEAAWLRGKVETTLLLNRHLNNFDINTDVAGNTAFLSGMVNSDIDKELAAAVALNVEGIDEVQNNLVVDKQALKRARKQAARQISFGQRVDDLTTTAVIRSKLMMSDNIDASKVDVSTRRDVVTLQGEVKTDEVKSLVYNLVANTEEVASVVNELKVVEQS